MSATPFATFGTGRTMGIVVAVAVIGFAAFLLLTAYAPDLRPGRDGGGHALSTSAVGFKGVVDLMRDTGTPVALIRDPAALRGQALVIATPGAEVTPKAMREFLTARGGRPTLIVLPKWAVRRQTTNPAWVEQSGMLPETAAIAPVRGLGGIAACRTGTRQFLCGPGAKPVLGTADGVMLARIGVRPLWVLADPDILDNHALATLAGARRAVTVLGAVSTEPERPIAFDLTLNGFARRPNLLKLAFEPPFFSLTLCLLAAAALAAFHASVRFGVPEREDRALALGKLALADNVAALLRLAKRSHRTGAAYATLVADDVARATGTRLGGDALVAYLDGLGSTPTYSSLARTAAEARDDAELLAAAQALHRWKETIN
ncbi:hypothetical protein HMP09_3560 [Sphingomonas sp. HMP9]|uniref:hypothetical protein n=1 Tax=Sphingomonas sp. HMP9 TaxID=1517554 RepID=UPI0015968F17|nr:hypothetical protein [Sphingomonas sp. HMP9]BCA64326.1 hypothetical protein HMP09_3560 [Sphingomonas sp. HMP9]